MSLRHRVALWIAAHDDSWLFIVLYVGLGLVLSMTISLFWLVAVVAAHAELEWFALDRKGIRDYRPGRVLWHLKLDIGLVLVANSLAASLVEGRQIRARFHDDLGGADPVDAAADGSHRRLHARRARERPAPLAGALIRRPSGRAGLGM